MARRHKLAPIMRAKIAQYRRERAALPEFQRASYAGHAPLPEGEIVTLRGRSLGEGGALAVERYASARTTRPF